MLQLARERQATMEPTTPRSTEKEKKSAEGQAREPPLEQAVTPSSPQSHYTDVVDIGQAKSTAPMESINNQESSRTAEVDAARGLATSNAPDEEARDARPNAVEKHEPSRMPNGTLETSQASEEQRDIGLKS